jgi:hypothetical protein
MSKTAGLPCKCEDDEVIACALCLPSKHRCACHDPEQRTALLAWLDRDVKRRTKDLGKIKKAMGAITACMDGVHATAMKELTRQLLPRYEKFSCPMLASVAKDWARIGRLASERKIDEMLVAMDERLLALGES